MSNLRINRVGMTLVDQVEDKLIEYFKENGLRPGSSIPNEAELAASLGIGRTVLREALSRFKMTGMIESRTKRGMVLAEPDLFSGLKRCVNPLLMNPDSIKELFEFRIIIEVGLTDSFFSRITPVNIVELEKIVEMEEATHKIYPSQEQCTFHNHIYKISGNKLIVEFQEAIMPILEHVMKGNNERFAGNTSKLSKDGEVITHRDLLEFIRKKDIQGYRDAIVKHFSIYSEYILEK